ncbi:MAG: hypothetical protein MJ159_05180 [Treponemataceae bacterium]|nr:hypothetical protein [Treponemataceae bacterium]
MRIFRKSFLFGIVICFISFLMCGCFNEKESPLYDSEWILYNADEKGQNYVHQLFLKPDHQATIQVGYLNSTTVLVWTGTYKANDKKIVFNFDKCARWENGQEIGTYKAGRVIKYFSGDYFYSLGLVGDEEKKYHLQLIRPKNYFYGKNLDFFGNQLDEFEKVK